MILAGLWIIQSKGTLFLLCLIWGRPLLSRFPKTYWSSVTFAILTISLLSQSVRGRLLIWFVGLKMGLVHLPWGGVGTGNFGKYYLTSLVEIFARFPILRTNLGDTAGAIDEAHNLIINSFAEMGLPGLVSSLFVFIGLFRIYKRFRAREVEADQVDCGLVLLLIRKLIYTVVLLSPNQVFSFWKSIGRPVPSNGFVKSRAIVNGKTMQDYGGGLCQVSGMLFHLALLVGMKTKERSSHSVDIYREEERHTPLGLDATVSFCIKDLVFQNTTGSAIQLEFNLWRIENKYIFSGKILSSKPIETRQIKVDRFDVNGLRYAMTKVYDGDRLEKEFHSRYVIGVSP